jgi:thioredoxin reductase (NADPH)
MDRETHETNVPGVYMAGSITTGWDTSDVFIENGRFDGEKIFADVVRGS